MAEAEKDTETAKSEVEKPAQVLSGDADKRPFIAKLPWFLLFVMAAFIAGLFLTPRIAPSLAPYIPWFDMSSEKDQQNQALTNQLQQLQDRLTKAEAVKETLLQVDQGLLDRISQLEKRPTKGAGADNKQALTGINERMNALELAFESQLLFEDRLRRLEENPVTSENDSEITQRLERLETAIRATQQDNQAQVRPALAQLAFAALKDQVASGASFQTTLDEFAPFIPEAGLPSLDDLRVHAADGVTGSDDIVNALQHLAPLFLQKSYAPADGGWWGTFQAKMRTMVSIRKTGPIEGDHPEAVLARMEILAADQNWQDLLETSNKLPAHIWNEPKLQSWRDDVVARSKVDHALKALGAFISDDRLESIKAPMMEQN